jgi:hypothetical protein
MVEFLADFNIQSRVGVLQDNVLLGFKELSGVEVFAGARLCYCVNVCPF